MKKIALFVFMSALCVFAQGPTGLQVLRENTAAPNFSALGFVSGTTTYVCTARTFQPVATMTSSAVSNASPAVVSATAHGMSQYSSITVTVTGGTGSWAAFNGVYTATYIGANSFSLPVDTTSFGAVTGTLVFSTVAPLSNQAVWSVSKTVVDGSGNLAAALNATNAWHNVCDNRATLSYQ